MNKKDKEEFVGIVAEALNDVMIPALESMEERLRRDLASKKDVQDLSMRMDSLNRKFDSQQERQDRHGKQLENHEKRIHVLEAASA
jgi:peptidoglycan hydrolase CwlO-like protein